MPTGSFSAEKENDLCFANSIAKYKFYRHTLLHVVSQTYQCYHWNIFIESSNDTKSVYHSWNTCTMRIQFNSNTAIDEFQVIWRFFTVLSRTILLIIGFMYFRLYFFIFVVIHVLISAYHIVSMQVKSKIQIWNLWIRVLFTFSISKHGSRFSNTSYTFRVQKSIHKANLSWVVSFAYVLFRANLFTSLI